MEAGRQVQEPAVPLFSVFSCFQETTLDEMEFETLDEMEFEN